MSREINSITMETRDMLIWCWIVSVSCTLCTPVFSTSGRLFMIQNLIFHFNKLAIWLVPPHGWHTMGALRFKFRPGHRMYLVFLGYKLYMERSRWCIIHKDLQNLQSQTTDFYDMLIKRLVSAPSLAYHQATIVPESQYVRKLKQLSGKFPLILVHQEWEVKTI
jgi:hypothetical protein